MRLALLTGLAATLSLAAVAGARAETVYIAEDYVAPAPGYIYSAPAPVVIAPPAAVIAAPPATVVAPPAVIAAPPAAVVAPPVVVAPVPAESGIVTTGFTTAPSCFIDWRGIERCY